MSTALRASDRVAATGTAVVKPILAERFKTKMCQNFEKTGVCPYEARCMFAHGDHDLRTKEMNLADNLVTEDAIKAFQRAKITADREKQGASPTKPSMRSPMTDSKLPVRADGNTPLPVIRLPKLSAAAVSSPMKRVASTASLAAESPRLLDRPVTPQTPQTEVACHMSPRSEMSEATPKKSRGGPLSPAPEITMPASPVVRRRYSHNPYAPVAMQGAEYTAYDEYLWGDAPYGCASCAAKPVSALAAAMMSSKAKARSAEPCFCAECSTSGGHAKSAGIEHAGAGDQILLA